MIIHLTPLRKKAMLRPLQMAVRVRMLMLMMSLLYTKQCWLLPSQPSLHSWHELSNSLPMATGPGMVPSSLISSHWMPSARLRTPGSTHLRVAVRVGMLARNVMHIVRKKEMRNTGRNTQSESHFPGLAELSSEKMTEPSGRLTGMQEQLR